MAALVAGWLSSRRSAARETFRSSSSICSCGSRFKSTFFIHVPMSGCSSMKVLLQPVRSLGGRLAHGGAEMVLGLIDVVELRENFLGVGFADHLLQQGGVVKDGVPYA